MLRWILILVAGIAFVMSFRTTSPGVLALMLLIALGSLFIAVLLFAAARVDSVMQGQSGRELSLILDARKRSKSAGPGNVAGAGPGSSGGHDQSHHHESASASADGGSSD